MTPPLLRCLALAVLSLAVAGCAVDQGAEVATYRKLIDLPLPNIDADTPLSLRDALLLANAENESLSRAGESYLRARIARRRAYAEFLPRFDLLPRYTARDPVAGSSGGDPAFLDVPARVDWQVLNLQNVDRYWQAGFVQRERRAGVLHEQELLIQDVADIYYRVVAAEASVKVLERSLATQQARLRDTQANREVGLARSLDVAQVEAQIAGTRRELIRARELGYTARALLSEMLARDVGGNPLVDGWPLPGRAAPLEQWLEHALDHRSDLSASAWALKLARQRVDQAIAQYYPSVTLNLDAFVYRESAPDQRLWQGYLEARLPVFSFGRIHADVREAWSFYREALLVRRQLHRQVAREVTVAHLELSTSEERLQQSIVQWQAVREAMRQAEQAYAAGLATNLDRILAQRDLLEAQLQVVTSVLDRKLKYLRLARSAGRLRELVEAMPAPLNPIPATRPAELPDDAFDLPDYRDLLRELEPGLEPASRPAATQRAPSAAPAATQPAVTRPERAATLHSTKETPAHG